MSAVAYKHSQAINKPFWPWSRDQPGAVDHRGLCPAMRHSWALETSSSQPGSRDSGEMTFFGHFSINYSLQKRPIRYDILIDRITKVRMKFGDTEIKATALDLATGQVLQITNPSFQCFDLQIQCSLLIFLTVLIFESQTRRFSSRFFIFPFLGGARYRGLLHRLQSKVLHQALSSSEHLALSWSNLWASSSKPSSELIWAHSSWLI